MGDNCPPGEHDLRFDHTETGWHRNGLEATVWVACHTDGCDAYFEGHADLEVPADGPGSEYGRTTEEEARAIYGDGLDQSPLKPLFEEADATPDDEHRLARVERPDGEGHDQTRAEPAHQPADAGEPGGGE